MAVIFGKIQGYLAATGLALAIIAGAFLYGRADGSASAKAEQAKANAKAVKKARGVEDEIQKMGSGDVDRQLSEWMRDGR
jgi:hypothetical protein